MAEPTVTSRSYGDFGEATYDIDDHEWHFEHSSDAITFRPLDDQPRESDDAGPNNDQTPDSPQPTTAEQLLDLDEIVNPHHNFPDGDQPFRHLLHSLLSVSEAVNIAIDEYDALLGNRIADGWIISSTTRRPLSVIANASGPGGSNVTISCLRNFRQGWNDDKHSWLKTPKPTEQSTTWKGPGAPVQQICLPDVEGNSQNAIDSRVAPFVAIRLPNRTTILQVREEGANLTILNAIDILEGCQHAHVCFNPWDGRQLAIMSIDASWCVWDLEGVRKLRATRYASVQGDISKNSTIFHDGWGRINFVGALDTVAVSTRRQILLYKVGQDAEQEGSLKLQLRKQKADVVLDTMVLPSHTSHLIVLTSIHLSIFFITENGDGIRNQCVLSVHHYANADDVSLHMITFMSKDDIVIWIRSRITTFSIIYKVSELEETHCKYSGPSVCEMSIPSVRSKTSDLAVLPIDTMISTNADEEGTLYRADVEQGVSFHQLCYVASDDELKHSIRMLTSGKETVQITPPDWERRNQSSGKDRVVEDITVKPTSRRGSMVDSKKKKIKPSHIHLEHIAQQLDEPLNDLQDLNSTLNAINQNLENVAVEKSLPFSRLADMVDDGHTIQLQDLKDSTTQLHEMLDHVSTSRQDSQFTNIDVGRRQLKVESVAMPASSSSMNLSDPNEIYDSIVASWITPLSSKVDGRVRRHKNRIAQHMTAELVLAGNLIRPLPSEKRDNVISASNDSGQQHDDDQGFSQFEEDYVMSQEADPVPSQGPPTPTSIAADHKPPLTSAPFQIEQYTTFTKPLPNLSKSVQNMLRHWEVGQDPSQYNHKLYDDQIQRELAEESDRSTHSDRDLEKKKKREEKRARKQREEARASQQERFMNSQLPILAISASQPADGRGSRYRDVQSQPDFMQATQSSQFPAVASQIQQGRHGGRPVKKKARQAGF